MSDKVWKGTWKPDGTGGWHTKSDKDIVDQYNSARLTPAPAQMLKDAIDEVIRLRAENEKLREVLAKQAEKHIGLIELMQEKETLHDPYEDGINAGLRLAVNIIKESVESGDE